MKTRPQFCHNETKFKLKALTGYYKYLWTVLFWMAATKKAATISGFLFKMGNGRHLYKPTGELDKTSEETNKIY